MVAFDDVLDKTKLSLTYCGAVLISDPRGRPYLREPLILPQAPVELFFDVEVDPLQDRGYVERRQARDQSRSVPAQHELPV